ncbi:hypothetical protein [Gimibacter soli]|uniref:Uncharacterized protein n=1 Tax=Gimibacter soli TaxID=3024400 RepID=A0AAF0BN35_9PROT|nr:hypothetical protein [Gimibacter soli]WCL55470.1 hypothetical protein PH603_06820 [Gimibacter soli]
MSRLLKTIVAASMVAGFTLSASAESRVSIVWHCHYKEGKGPQDLLAINGKWLKLARTKVKGGDLNSYLENAVFGKIGHFVFVDSYPSLSAYEDVRKWMMSSDEGKAIEAEFNAASECKKNEVYDSWETMPAK